MDQPVCGGGDYDRHLHGPCAAGPGKAGADNSHGDGVGGGAVFAFKDRARGADRWKKILPGTDGNLSCGEVSGRRKPAAFVL